MLLCDYYQDIREENLVDIHDITINTSLPVTERILDYIRQIKNPYVFKCGKITVINTYVGIKELEDILNEWIQSF